MRTTRLVIELEDGPGPISGWLLEHAADDLKPFSGYMELIAVLEAARLRLPQTDLPEGSGDEA